uniref:E3 ubiquitin-protein ligase n=1 Tax=Panagrolaimus davidi TaxID=227884 RepID=A0A914Q372_9BILA
MLKNLIQDVLNENWLKAAELVYDNWSENCYKIFDYSANDVSWNYQGDLKHIILLNLVLKNEINLERELLAPLIAMYTLEEPLLENDDIMSLKLIMERYETTVRKPGERCGKIFKSGDLFYICKECTKIETEVLCAECFKESAHDTHDYEVFKSSGKGGYCDCGDPEAGYKSFSCNIHTNELLLGDDKL